MRGTNTIAFTTVLYFEPTESSSLSLYKKGQLLCMLASSGSYEWHQKAAAVEGMSDYHFSRK